MTGRVGERCSRKREQHCKGSEAVKGVNGWSPPTPQPTAVSVERVEVGAELSRRRVMPLTFTQSVHSLDQHPSHSHS